MIVCLSTVAVPPDVRDRYLAWIGRDQASSKVETGYIRSRIRVGPMRRGTRKPAVVHQIVGRIGA
jgi:hypothetical protein